MGFMQKRFLPRQLECQEKSNPGKFFPARFWFSMVPCSSGQLRSGLDQRLKTASKRMHLLSLHGMTAAASSRTDARVKPWFRVRRRLCP
jgi:hypothetical protein